MKIYTRTGDTGQTGLLDGSRVSKSHARVSAYGEIDELSALLGLVRSHAGDGPLNDLVSNVQRDLFALGTQLADPTGRVAERKQKASLTRASVARLESSIDGYEAEMAPLAAFILPGGTQTGALLHLARTVCRRAERAVVALVQDQAADPIGLEYLNRLSDLLFVLARHENQLAGQPESTW